MVSGWLEGMIGRLRSGQEKGRGLGGAGRQRSVRGLAGGERREWGGRSLVTVGPGLPVVSGVRSQTARIGERCVGTAGGRWRVETSGVESGGHGAVFLQATSEGKIQASRSQKEKEKNPDRICLDRRGLTQVPKFVGEKDVRLLSLQHNLINRLEGMQNVGISKLVFLDLYNNQVENISGLEPLDSLRVLLLGKNRIKRIEGLSLLTRLEVLDLHGNQISRIAGLSTLRDLKVLNLAGNQIRAVEEKDLEGLTSLQELNLKRNRLRRISDLSGPLNLEKLFLSNNEVLSVDDLSGICKATSLREVTLDSNPVAVANDCVHLLVSSLPRLHLLSRMQVTDQLRRNAFHWRNNRENRGDAPRGDVISNATSNWELLRKQTKSLPLMSSSLKDLRTIDELDSKTIQSDSLLSVASSITLSSRDSLRARASFAAKPSLSEDTGVESLEGEFFKLPPILGSLTGEGEGEGEVQETSVGEGSETEEEEGEEGGGKRSKGGGEWRRVEGRKGRAGTGTGTGRGKGKAPGSGAGAGAGPGQGKVREQGGDYLIEICGRCLNVYGQGALRFIDRPWNPVKAGEVTTVRFSYVSFGGISNVLGKLKQRFPKAENFVFRETNMTWLGQLNALADVQGLSSLQIDEEGNPISEKKWRSYAIYRLAHWGLKSVNGVEVTEEELAEVSREFEGLSELVMRSLPETLLQPLLTRLRIDGSRSNPHQTARQWLWGAEPALRGVVVKEALQWRRGTQDDLYWRHRGKNQLSYMIDLTCAAVEKLQLLESRWPSILNHLIRETLVDYSHIDSYMKKCLQDLH